jgi:hypothetical protein
MKVFLVAAVLVVAGAIGSWAQSAGLAGVHVSTDRATLSSLAFAGDGTLEISDGVTGIQETAGYTLSYDGKVPFVTVRHTNGKLEKWLTLFPAGKNPRGMFVYRRGGEEPLRYWGNDPLFLGADSVTTTASAELSDGATLYGPGNTVDLRDGRPWATKGSAVGQSVTIGTTGGGADIRSLALSIGFVSYDKPYLYEANSRPHEIRISDLGGRFTVDMSLEDTPDIQFVNLPESTSGVKIEVLSIYPGSRWMDTCVNLILPASDYWAQ